MIEKTITFSEFYKNNINDNNYCVLTTSTIINSYISYGNFEPDTSIANIVTFNYFNDTPILYGFFYSRLPDIIAVYHHDSIDDNIIYVGYLKDDIMYMIGNIVVNGSKLN